MGKRHDWTTKIPTHGRHCPRNVFSINVVPYTESPSPNSFHCSPATTNTETHRSTQTCAIRRWNRHVGRALFCQTALSRPSGNRPKATELIRTSTAFYTTIRLCRHTLTQSHTLASKSLTLTIIPTLTAWQSTTVPNLNLLHFAPTVFYNAVQNWQWKTYSCIEISAWTRRKQNDTSKYAPNQRWVEMCAIIIMDYHEPTGHATTYCAHTNNCNIAISHRYYHYKYLMSQTYDILLFSNLPPHILCHHPNLPQDQQQQAP